MEDKLAEVIESDNMKSYVDSLLQELCNFGYDKVYRR